MEVYGFDEEVAVSQFTEWREAYTSLLKVYRAGYEKGQQEGFQKANSQDYYIGLED